MLYEGIIEIMDDIVNIELCPQSAESSSLSHYNLQLPNISSDITSVVDILQPSLAPDAQPEESKSYVAGLQKTGFGNFYADSLNILDLQRIYKGTEPYHPKPFPGFEVPVQSGEVIFTEIVPNFTGYLNKEPIIEKFVTFTYRRRLQ